MQIKERAQLVKDDLRYGWASSYVWRVFGFSLLLYLIVTLLLAIYWSREPDQFSVIDNAQEHNSSVQLVTGAATTTTLIKVVDVMLHKPGGFLSNDIMPPGVALDNIPNWEFGVLVQVRDLASSMRKHLSRSQTQSTEDKDLSIAEPRFNFDNSSWIFPRSEDYYREGIEKVQRYLVRLSEETAPDAQFFTRADNLALWLEMVETRLGSLSQRLSASVGQKRLNTDLAGDPNANQATSSAAEITIKTPWLELDDVFYEARGNCWALIHFFKAIEYDFHDVLEDKNALVSLRQIIRELEATQVTLWSPVVLNGGGFGVFANHSLVMASYISRANAGISDLRELLNRG